MTLRSDDRVLLLDIPPDQEIAVIARILMQGVLVALGSEDAVDQARSAFAAYENVMFLPASPQQIPWRDAYFTRIFIPEHMQASARPAAGELQRVLAPGGQILSDSVKA